MIKPGEWHKAKHWGRFLINRVVELPEPAISYTEKWGETSFRPVLAEIQWENGTRQFWLPYYIGPIGKERYAQFAPMVSEVQFMGLLTQAISQGFFSQEGLSQLAAVIDDALRR